MALDLTYNIRKHISPIANDPAIGTKELEIQALDDLDERYLIRTKDSDGMWLNFVKSPLWIEHICSPEKGIIEVTVRKDYPKYRGCEDEEKFLKDVAAYFTDVFGGDSIFGTSFRMRGKHTFDKATSERMVTNSEGDEIGWESYDVDVYIGTTFTLDGPTYGDEESYSTGIDEDKKAFILRKLEAIFDEKGAYCREIPHIHSVFGECFHYEFKISNF